MKKFIYTATNTNGETYTRTVEAGDRFEIYDLVRKENGTIVSIKDAGSFFGGGFFSKADAFLGTVKEAEKIIFARNVSTMIKSGLPLSRSLDVMIRQTKNKKFKEVLQAIIKDINAGESLHVALGKFPKIFSPLFVSMVKAGEESGKLSETFLVIAHQMEEAYSLKRKIRGALIYPSIILIAMFVIGILMMMFVVPTLSSTFKELGADLPKSTQIIISTSGFLVNNTLVSLLSIAIVFFGLIMALRTKRGKRMVDFIILRVPVISELVKETNSARTARTLSSLLSAGVGVVSSFSITQDVLQNSYYKDVLGTAKTNVEKGSPIAQVFMENTDIYPVMVGDMISVGEETGQLSQVLMEVADFYEEDVSQRTKDLSTIIEPFLMIIIGTAVGFFAISMITPIYSISGSI